MLHYLSVQNIVLIEKAELTFEPGLCVLTGETGAGKSILLDALGLALGMRGESRLLRKGAEQGIVTAEFGIGENQGAQDALRELGIEAGSEVIIRRHVSADGKTRCFIDDQPVSVSALKLLGEGLIEVHGQHDQRGLMDPGTHLEWLDAYGGLQAKGREVEAAFSAWKLAQKRLEKLREETEKARREEEYMRFMQQELDQLAPKPGEEEELAELRTRMMQSEKLADTLNDVMRELQGDHPIDGALRSAQRILDRSSLAEGVRFSAIIEILDRAAAEVEEAQLAIEKLAEECAYDPNRLEQVEERLFALRAASRKYNLPVEELQELLEEVTEKLMQLDNRHHDMQELEQLVSEKKAVYRERAEALSEARRKAARQMENAVMAELVPLKMAETDFCVMQTALPEEEWSARGLDRVRFEAATNRGSAHAPLHKIASGGELSRFMLAMKVVLSRIKSTPTLIFDEVDSGTGGAVADAIGQRLALLSELHQVLVVTHLPQVASKGTQHFRIQKQSKKQKTVTSVEVLDVEARKEELARMLAGAEVTKEARSAAKRLLEAG